MRAAPRCRFTATVDDSCEVCTWRPRSRRESVATPGTLSDPSEPFGERASQPLGLDHAQGSGWESAAQQAHRARFVSTRRLRHRFRPWSPVHVLISLRDGRILRAGVPHSLNSAKKHCTPSKV